MAYYAFLDDNNIVTEVITGRNETEHVDGINDWEEHYGQIRGQICKRTSYNTRGNINQTTGLTGFRYNFASIGFTFDPTVMPDGAFISPQPYPSWILNDATKLWEAPTPRPDDGNLLQWSEEDLAWVPVV